MKKIIFGSSTASNNTGGFTSLGLFLMSLWGSSIMFDFGLTDPIVRVESTTEPTKKPTKVPSDPTDSPSDPTDAPTPPPNLPEPSSWFKYVGLTGIFTYLGAAGIKTYLARKKTLEQIKIRKEQLNIEKEATKDEPDLFKPPTDFDPRSGPKIINFGGKDAMIIEKDEGISVMSDDKGKEEEEQEQLKNVINELQENELKPVQPILEQVEISTRSIIYEHINRIINTDKVAISDISDASEAVYYILFIDTGPLPKKYSIRDNLAGRLHLASIILSKIILSKIIPRKTNETDIDYVSRVLGKNLLFKYVNKRYYPAIIENLNKLINSLEAKVQYKQLEALLINLLRSKEFKRYILLDSDNNFKKLLKLIINKYIKEFGGEKNFPPYVRFL